MSAPITSGGGDPAFVFRPVDSLNDLLDLHVMFRDTKLVVIDLERRGQPVMMMFKVTQ